MQKKLLAAVVASMVAGQAMAITVVDDGTNKFSVGGHVGMRYVNSDSDTTAKGDSSRFNLAFEHKLSSDVAAFAKGEWGFDVTDSDDKDGKDTFKNRLGYVGVKHSTLGSVTVGKQWSTYSMLSDFTDVFAIHGGDASGAYDLDSTYRADDSLQYNISLQGLNISAQFQTGDAEDVDNIRTRDNGYALAMSYDLDFGLSFGAAYNQVSFKESGKGDAKAAIVGVKYTRDALYAAATYTETSNHTDTTGKTQGTELYVSYQLNENYKFETGYNGIDFDNSDKETSYFPVAVVYTTGPVQLSATYKFDQSKDADENDAEDELVLQARYYF